MLLVCLCLAAIASSAISYPGGAPGSACAGMTPNHWGYSPSSLNTANPEFGITVSSTTYAANDVINVTISGTRSFRGFLIIASTVDGTPVGFFVSRGSTAAGQVQNRCGSHPNSGLTHTLAFRDNQMTANAQSAVELDWRAPAAVAGHLRFYATIVEKFDTFYVRVPSDTISDGSPPPTTPGAPAPPPELTGPIEVSGCGRTKSCWTDAYCSDWECDFLISWRKLNDTKLEFEFLTAGAGNNTYAAIGFAGSDLMVDVSVAACSVSQSGVAMVREFLAPNKQTGVVSQTTQTIRSGTATLSGTKLGCRFIYDNGQAIQNTVLKDLTKTRRLMVARGFTTGNTLLQHTYIPIVSPAAFAFDFFSVDYQAYRGVYYFLEPPVTEPTSLSPRAHGSLLMYFCLYLIIMIAI